MAFEQRSPGNFDLQASISPDVIANVMARKKQQEIAMEEAGRNKRMSEAKAISDAVSSSVSSMVELSKERQKKAFVASLSDALATTEALTPNPDGKTASFDPNKSEAIRSAVQLAPEEAAKSILKSAMPGAAGKLSGRDIQQFWLYNPETKDRKSVTYNELTGEISDLATGSPLDKEKLGGYQMIRATPQIRTDAAGNLQIIDPFSSTEMGRLSTGAPAIPEAKHNTVDRINHPLIPKEDRAEIVSQITKAKTDEVIKKSKDSLKTLDGVMLNLKTGNKVATDRLGGLVQKLVALDSGNLAQWEQRDPGARDVISRIQQYYTMSVKGELSAKNKAELVKLLENAETNLLQNMQETVGSHTDTITALYPQLKRDWVEKSIGLASYQKRKEKMQGSGQTAAESPPFNVDMNAIDAELRRRGLK